MEDQLLNQYRKLLSREAILVMEIEISERQKDVIKLCQLKKQKEEVKHERLSLKSSLKLNA